MRFWLKALMQMRWVLKCVPISYALQLIGLPLGISKRAFGR